MIVTGARVSGFLARPDPALRAALFYGPDYGLVRERAAALIGASGGDPDDPFATVELSAAQLHSDPAALADEAAALSFSGKRKVVRIRDPREALVGAIESWLAESPRGEALVVVEANELAKRAPLRRVFETAPAAAAVPCYPDEGADLLRFISAALAEQGVTVSPDAAAFLAARFGADRALGRRELEKLALYVGDGGRIDLDAAEACVGDSASASLGAVADAACAGDLPALDRALARAYADGQHPASVLRATARHVQRLLLARGAMAAGKTAEKAMEGLRPPLFFKQRASFVRQLQLWPAPRLALALDILTQAELDCKTTGMPAAALCARALMRLAHAARVGGKR